MQIHYYVREDIVVDGAGDINFVTIFVVVRIDYHLMNDGLSIAMLTSRVVGGLSFVSVFTSSTSMNTMNNVLPIVTSANEQNVFVHVPNTSGSAIDFEDTLWNMFEKELPKYNRLDAIFP
jgi:hypothetical protein